jgi:phosphopantothenoylcysteine decarboxylase/phosphopantothenate--cysteine ligase
MNLTSKTIAIGVTACSPASKTIDLVRDLCKKGADVHIIMTPNSVHFVSPILLQRESGNPLQIEQFELPKSYDPNYRSISVKADLIVVAPASANTIGKIANGIADNLLTTTILSSKAPVLIAMHINPVMFTKASVQRNIRQLKEDGFLFSENPDGQRPSMFPSIELISKDVDVFFAE